jgi:hypothetical protein
MRLAHQDTARQRGRVLKLRFRYSSRNSRRFFRGLEMPVPPIYL